MLLHLLLAVPVATASEPAPLTIRADAPVCAQLARTLPLEAPTPKRASWRFNTRGGLRRLFEDAVTQFGVDPIDKNDAIAWKRASDMCTPIKEGGQCRLEGPVQFVLKYDDQAQVWNLEAGARAVFRVEGTVLECEDVAADFGAHARVR
jgi:hypothetical protein